MTPDCGNGVGESLLTGVRVGPTQGVPPSDSVC